MSGFAAGRSLLHDLNPQRVGQAMLTFQQVAKNKQEQQTFQRLMEQHQTDLMSDKDYRKHFTSVMKRNPSALMSLQGLSEARGSVGMIRESLGAADQLAQRVSQYAATEDAKAQGFNPQPLMQQIETLKSQIKNDPQNGGKALLQLSGLFSSRISEVSRDSHINRVIQETPGNTPLEKMGHIFNSNLPQAVKQGAMGQLSMMGALQAKQATAQSTARDKLNPFGPLAKRVTNKEGLAQLRADVGEAEQRGLITADQAKDAVSQGEAAEKAAAARKAELKDIDIDQARFEAVSNILGEDTTREGIIQEFENDIEGFTKTLTAAGIKDVGEFMVQLRDTNSVLSKRFGETAEVVADNRSLLRDFIEAGGRTEHSDKTPIFRSKRTEKMVEVSPDLRGSLTIIEEGTGERSTVPLFEDFTPQPSGQSKGLIGVSKMRLSETVSIKGRNQGEVIGLTPSFDAVSTAGTDAGDQIQMQFPEIAAAPIQLLSPRSGNANAGELKNELVKDAEGNLTRQSIRKFNSDAYFGEIADQTTLKITFASLKQMRKSLDETIAETTDKDVKEGLKIAKRNLRNIENSVTNQRRIDLPGQKPVEFNELKASKDEDTKENHDAKKLLLTRMLIEQGRINAILFKATRPNVQESLPEVGPNFTRRKR